MPKIRAKYFLFIIPAIIGLMLLLILPHFPEFAEYVFSRGFFVVLSHVMSLAVNLVPFSCTEIALYFCIVTLICLIVLLVVKKIKAVTFFQIILWSLSILFLLYMLMHGVNFYRQPLAELMNLKEITESDYDEEYLYQQSCRYAVLASAARMNITEDEQGCMVLTDGVKETLKRADSGYDNIKIKYSFLSGSATRAKPVIISSLWSYTGITGMYSPFFSEANVNVDIPDCSLPSAAAHEIAHTRGFAREDECNFLAYLSCINSDDPDYIYSGYLLAYKYLSGELYRINKELYEKSYQCLSDGVVRDLLAENDYWNKFEGPVQDVSSGINDTFIKAQGVDDGVKSYGRVTELLIRYEKTVNG